MKLVTQQIIQIVNHKISVELRKKEGGGGEGDGEREIRSSVCSWERGNPIFQNAVLNENKEESTAGREHDKKPSTGSEWLHLFSTLDKLLDKRSKAVLSESNLLPPTLLDVVNLHDTFQLTDVGIDPVYGFSEEDWGPELSVL